MPRPRRKPVHQFDQLSRRALLRLGASGLSFSALAAGGVGLNWTGLLQARANARPTETPGLQPLKACIIVFYYGGPSHLDTYDLKPDAPTEIRGEFQSISTSVPGLFVCEHLPRMSRVMHKVAQIRSMHHLNRLHDSASTEALTGPPGANRRPRGVRPDQAGLPGLWLGAELHAAGCADSGGACGAAVRLS